MVPSPGDGYSDTTNADDSPHIHFSGEWTSSERQTVRETIERVETTLEVGQQPGFASKPWLCVNTYVEDKDTRFYFASRMKLSYVFRGRSAQELADAITRRFPS